MEEQTPNPDLILSIEGADPFALRAIEFPQNSDRLWVPGGRGGSPQSRSVTPFKDDDSVQTKSPAAEDRQCLLLNFSMPPKDIKKGYVFGSDPKYCDVVVGQKAHGISGEHFAIFFDGRLRLVLENLSRHGTAVSYNDRAGNQKRQSFRWLLPPGWDVKVHLRGEDNHVFRIVQPDRSKCMAEYTRLAEEYLDRSGSLPLNDKFGAMSAQTTDEQPLYIERECLGSGRYGIVYKAVNATTGDWVAVKIFKAGMKFANEVNIMKSVSHESIIQYIDFIDGARPSLAMEYLPLGSLASHTLTGNESRMLFTQMLQALDYLHKSGIAHRDIKPPNILIQQRDGDDSHFRAKLSDFGFAKSSEALESFCGTDLFIAPEIWEAVMARRATRYTSAVDIWSLGVVMLNLFRSLPAWRGSTGKRRQSGKRRVAKASRRLGWCRKIVEEAVELREASKDDALFLVLTKMLIVRDTERLGASECLWLYLDNAPTASLPPEEEINPLRASEYYTTNLTRTNTASSTSHPAPGQLTRMASQLHHDLHQDGFSLADSTECLPIKLQDEDVEQLLSLGAESWNGLFDESWSRKRKRSPEGDTNPETQTRKVRRLDEGCSESWPRKRKRSPEVDNNQEMQPRKVHRLVEKGDKSGEKATNRVNQSVGNHTLNATTAFLEWLYSKMKGAGEDDAPNVSYFARGISIYAERLGVQKFRTSRENGKMEVKANTGAKPLRPGELVGLKKPWTLAEVASAVLWWLQGQKLDDERENDTNAAKNQKCLRMCPVTDATSIQECKIKSQTVHFRLSDQKICLDDVGRVLGRTYVWIARELDSIPPESKAACAHGTFVDFGQALPTIKKLGLKGEVLKATKLNKVPPARQEFQGKTYTYTMLRGTVVHLQHCRGENRINSSHLLRAAGRDRNARDAALEACGITDGEQLPPHPTLQGRYISYADARKLCEYLGLEVPYAILEDSVEATVLPDPDDDDVQAAAAGPPSSPLPHESSPKSRTPPTKPTSYEAPDQHMLYCQWHSGSVNEEAEEEEKADLNKEKLGHSSKSDLMSSRRSYWGSMYSHLSEKHPDYAPQPVGAPSEGLLFNEPSLFGSSELKYGISTAIGEAL